MSTVFVPQMKDAKSDPSHIQKLLDENNQLIRSITEYQMKGRGHDCFYLHKALHRNIVYLSSLSGTIPESQMPAPPNPNSFSHNPQTAIMYPPSQKATPPINPQQPHPNAGASSNQAPPNVVTSERLNIGQPFSAQPPTTLLATIVQTPTVPTQSSSYAEYQQKISAAIQSSAANDNSSKLPEVKNTDMSVDSRQSTPNSNPSSTEPLSDAKSHSPKENSSPGLVGTPLSNASHESDKSQDISSPHSQKADAVNPIPSVSPNYQGQRAPSVLSAHSSASPSLSDQFNRSSPHLPSQTSSQTFNSPALQAHMAGQQSHSRPGMNPQSMYGYPSHPYQPYHYPPGSQFRSSSPYAPQAGQPGYANAQPQQRVMYPGYPQQQYMNQQMYYNGPQSAPVRNAPAYCNGAASPSHFQSPPSTESNS